MPWNTIPEVHPQNDASQNDILGHFLSGINLTNTSPCPTEYWVTMHSGTYFLQKNKTGYDQSQKSSTVYEI
jgi:hypothetical protein